MGWLRDSFPRERFQQDTGQTFFRTLTINVYERRVPVRAILVETSQRLSSRIAARAIYVLRDVINEEMNRMLLNAVEFS
jgi:hypothetical protein